MAANFAIGRTLLRRDCSLRVGHIVLRPAMGTLEDFGHVANIATASARRNHPSDRPDFKLGHAIAPQIAAFLHRTRHRCRCCSDPRFPPGRSGFAPSRARLQSVPTGSATQNRSRHRTACRSAASFPRDHVCESSAGAVRICRPHQMGGEPLLIRYTPASPTSHSAGSASPSS